MLSLSLSAFGLVQGAHATLLSSALIEDKPQLILPLPTFPHTRLTPSERAAGALGSGGGVVSRAGAV